MHKKKMIVIGAALAAVRQHQVRQKGRGEAAVESSRAVGAVMASSCIRAAVENSEQQQSIMQSCSSSNNSIAQGRTAGGK